LLCIPEKGCNGQKKGKKNRFHRSFTRPTSILLGRIFYG
jgi:hypothetical protein